MPGEQCLQSPAGALSRRVSTGKSLPGDPSGDPQRHEMAAWDALGRFISGEHKAKAASLVAPAIKTYYPVWVLQWLAVMKIYVHHTLSWLQFYPPAAPFSCDVSGRFYWSSTPRDIL